MATLFASATGADAVLTLPPPPEATMRTVLGALVCSYSGSVTTGRLRVMSGTTVVLDVDVTQEAVGRLQATLVGEPGQGMEVRLYAGGGSVDGKINLLSYSYARPGVMAALTSRV